MNKTKNNNDIIMAFIPRVDKAWFRNRIHTNYNQK
jgi:hypothetical protein